MLTKRISSRISLDEVPDEIFVDGIFLFVGVQIDLLRLHLVCKKFLRILTSNEYLYKKLCLIRWKECFVVHLPLQIMQKYYDNQFRNMFYMNNKHRFCHYTTTKTMNLRTPEEVREFDRVHKTDVENQLIQGVCMDYKLFHGEEIEDFYSNNRFRYNDEISLTLEIVFDFGREEMFVLQDDGVYVDVFVAIIERKNGGRTRTIDERFPKYFAVFHYPGDNISGYIYEENSKRPILSKSDGELGTYLPREHIQHQQTQERNQIFNSFQKIYRENNLSAEYTSRSTSNDNDIRNWELGCTLEEIRSWYIDHLEYTNQPIFKATNNKNNGKPIVIVHFVDDSGRWSNRGTMKGISQNYGTEAKDNYENNDNVQLGGSVSTFYDDLRIYVYSMVCVSRNATTTSGRRSFQDDYFRSYQMMEKLRQFCKNNGILDIHFDMPKRGSLENYENQEIRKEFNVLVRRDGFKVFFHDREFRGQRSIYKEFIC